MEPPPQPQTFDLGNWDEFCADALRYHAATRPNDQLIVHKIETLRAFMSENAIQYLAGFVRLHPRFHTVQGWDQWSSRVAELLADQELLPRRGFNYLEDSTTADEIVTKFRKGKSCVYVLWQELDELVALGKLTSSEQREVFWSALSKDEQARFVSRSSAFDPEDKIWTDKDSEDAKLAEQELSRIAEASLVDDMIPQVRNLTVICVCGFLLGCPIQGYFLARICPIALRENSLLGWIFYTFFFAVFSYASYSVSTVVFNNWSHWRKLKAKQRELWSLQHLEC